MAPTDGEVYGSLVCPLRRETEASSSPVMESRGDRAARSARANGRTSFALSLGKAAVCVAIGIAVGRHGDRAASAASGGGVASSLSSASAAATAAAGEGATSVAAAAAAGDAAEAANLMPFTTGLPYTAAFRMDARANAAVSTGARATWSVAATGRLARLPGDNARWTDEAAAAWKCCARVDESGEQVNNPPFAQPDVIRSMDGVLEVRYRANDR